jgi:hypothetical protein
MDQPVYVVRQVEWGGDVDGTGPERWLGQVLGRFTTEQEAWAFVDSCSEYCEIEMEI